jgi:N6-L-threonylcarbamoyladenine synthase
MGKNPLKMLNSPALMIVLGLETTCDETACAIVRDGKEILSNVIYSQADLHSKYGGVFPELACRRHIDVLIPVIQEALTEAQITQKEIDLIAVAKGPGLIGALLIGLNAAKTLSIAWNKPFIGVNHVEAHLYAAMMGKQNYRFPALGVVISGGHTFLVKILELGVYEMIGTTVDDAIGEAFDKVAGMLGLPYPGGPAIEALAKTGNPSLYAFKAGKVKERPWDFSFSGMKTNVLYTLKGQNQNKDGPLAVAESEKPHIAAAFQEAALKEIVEKSLKAAAHFGCVEIFLGGGVSNNKRLRELFAEKNQTIPITWPPFGLSLDNGAMIAGLGTQLFLQSGRGDLLDLEPLPRMPLR